MTNPFTEYRMEPNRRRPHDHAPTPLELQRWEDDGGAVGSEPRLRRVERHCREFPEDRAAA
ncbi:MAG TPA: hypothetical protein VHU15_09790 [Stellaceae bacterium]|nr:hypothetical protein [Stellaceae bacterium]